MRRSYGMLTQIRPGASRIASSLMPIESVRRQSTSARLRTGTSWSGVLVRGESQMAQTKEQRIAYQLERRRRDPNYGKQAAARARLAALREKGLSFCIACRAEKSITEFYFYSQRNRPRNTCIPCHKAYGASPARRAAQRQKAYHKLSKNIEANRHRTSGFTQALWDAAWLLQDGLCAICQCNLTNYHNPHVSKGPKMCADHDHRTKTPRGILCSGCNKALGFFKDCPIRLQAAIGYLATPPLSVLV